MRPPLTPFQTRLGYQFRKPDLLQQALRHRSAGKPNNERLEFLGDAVLGFIVSDMLYRQYPALSEGELSRWRSMLVQRTTLVEIARKLRLGDELLLGAGELKSGGAQRESILADATEALLCAIYLDGGLAVCSAKLHQWLLPFMEGLGQDQTVKDAKTRLQEKLQAQRQPLPVYVVTAITGSDHAQRFTVSCQVASLQQVAVATGNSRKEAEQQAAMQVLEQLERAHG